MTQKNSKRIATTLTSANDLPEEPGSTELPPDPDGYFARLAQRGEKVLAFYEPLGGFDREEIVGFLLLDLLHVRDRDPELGDLEDSFCWAMDMYATLVEESRQMAETPYLP